MLQLSKKNDQGREVVNIYRPSQKKKKRFRNGQKIYIYIYTKKSCLFSFPAKTPRILMFLVLVEVWRIWKMYSKDTSRYNNHLIDSSTGTIFVNDAKKKPEIFLSSPTEEMSGQEWLQGFWFRVLTAPAAPASKSLALRSHKGSVDGSEIRRSPVEVDSLSHSLYKVLYIPSGCLGCLPSVASICHLEKCGFMIMKSLKIPSKKSDSWSFCWSWKPWMFLAEKLWQTRHPFFFLFVELGTCSFVWCSLNPFLLCSIHFCYGPLWFNGYFFI